ncbi:MAG: hypothetical protein AAB425_05670, partial [Bdellovibrionota bacterium]
VGNPSLERRKKLLINPRFQVAFMGYMVVIAASTAAIFFSANLYFFHRFRALGLQVGYPSNHVFFEFLDRQQSFMGWVFLVTALAASTLIALFGLYLSHRVSGPLHRLKGHMSEVAQGHTLEDVQFRKSDFFAELGESFNQTMVLLREAQAQAVRTPKSKQRDVA